MTLPSSDSFDSYGGSIIDYSQVEDVSTDLNSESSNSLRASVAAMTATSFRAIVIFDGYAQVINNYTACWDITSSTNPTITKVDVGIYRVTFPSSIFDVRGQTQSLNLLGGIANIDVDNVDGNFCSVNRVSSIIFDVYLWSVLSFRVDLPGKNIMLMVR